LGVGAAAPGERNNMKAIQRIPLQQIDLRDETFSVNFMPDLQRLRSSIEEVGLIQPVLLREKGDRYQIVCGFRRISVYHELKGSEIEARVFAEKEMNDLQLFSLSLHDNVMTRGFNTVEKALALDKLIHYFQIEPPDVIKTFLPFFSLEPHDKILKTYLSLAGMEDKVRSYVLKEEVSRFNIRILSHFSSEDRMALLPLFDSMKLGENRLREVLTLLEEISQRSQTSIREIVHRPEIELIVSQKELTPAQKTERLKKILLDLRYPRMHQMEKRFEKKREELNLRSGLSLHHPPFFEGKGLRIEFRFDTMEEYQSILSSLSLLADKKEFQEMLQKD
jgi:ParB family transcriptional regulator, chromosome partitioning protein